MRPLLVLATVVALAGGCGGHEGDRGSPAARAPSPGGALTQCAGPSLVVEGLAVSKIANTRLAGRITWTDDPIELLGRVSGTTLVVSDTAL